MSLRHWRLTPAVLTEVDKVFPARLQERRVVKGQLAGKVARKYAAVIVATELLRNTG